MKQIIDLTKEKEFKNNWMLSYMGRGYDTIVISEEQKAYLEGIGKYEEFEKNCNLRFIKIKVNELKLMEI